MGSLSESEDHAFVRYSIEKGPDGSIAYAFSTVKREKLENRASPGVESPTAGRPWSAPEAQSMMNPASASAWPVRGVPTRGWPEGRERRLDRRSPAHRCSESSHLAPEFTQQL